MSKRPSMATDKHEQTTENALTSRLAAVDVLDWVLRRRRTLDDALAGSRHIAALSPEDRAFSVFIVRTCLQRLGQIDTLIDTCLHSPLPRKTAAVRDVLRVGTAQLLFSATAPHAAVSTTVNLCRAVRHDAYVKLVNAVMRRLQREGDALIAKQDVTHLNTPDWLWASWAEAYGEDTARALAAQHLIAAPLDLSVRSDPKKWARDLGGKVILGSTVRVAVGGDVQRLPGYEEGAWWVQDAAARLPTHLLGNIEGADVIDLCAAPGGKTLTLCAAGAHVTAVDISEKRLSRLRENLSRTGMTADVVCADVRDWSPSAPADIVVLDAPCSATGTIRRHPDLPHLKSAADIEKLVGVQDSLLDRAAGMLKSGGILLFVTCSLQSAEGPERIEAFLERNPAFSRAPFAADALPTLPQAITAEGALRTFPHFLHAEGGMDGFFAAGLRKTNA